MIRLTTLGTKKVWLFIQQLHRHLNNDSSDAVPTDKFLCYFKFSEPTLLSLGELIHDPQTNTPVRFNSFEEAEEFATRYLNERLNQVIDAKNIFSTGREKFGSGEIEVLLLIAEGLTNIQIANKLCISVRTVESRRQKLLDKTQTLNTASLIRFACRNNLID